MPEIAEVKLISDNIFYFLGGKQIVSVVPLNPEVIGKWLNRCVKGLEAFNTALTSRKMVVKGVDTRGKFCWITISDGGNEWYAMIGFGMSGNIRPEPTDKFLDTYRNNGNVVTKEEYMKHCHLKISFRDGDEVKNIYYHDIRRFGSWTFTDDVKVLNAKLNKLGKDPLTETPNTKNMSDDQIIGLFRTPNINNQNICKALMSQSLIAGIGNYVKAETLYVAKIHPLAVICDIPDSALLMLYKAIQEIAKSAYTSGGASLYTYSGINGDKSEFKTTLKVYGKDLDPFGNPVERIPDTQSPDKRSTFWVPKVQTIGVKSPVPKKIIIIKKVVPIDKNPC